MIAFRQTRRQMIVVSAVPAADISAMVRIAVVTVTEISATGIALTTIICLRV